MDRSAKAFSSCWGGVQRKYLFPEVGKGRVGLTNRLQESSLGLSLRGLLDPTQTPLSRLQRNARWN